MPALMTMMMMTIKKVNHGKSKKEGGKKTSEEGY